MIIWKCMLWYTFVSHQQRSAPFGDPCDYPYARQQGERPPGFETGLSIVLSHVRHPPQILPILHVAGHQTHYRCGHWRAFPIPLSTFLCALENTHFYKKPNFLRRNQDNFCISILEFQLQEVCGPRLTICFMYWSNYKARRSIQCSGWRFVHPWPKSSPICTYWSYDKERLTFCKMLCIGFNKRSVPNKHPCLLIRARG